MIRLEHVSKAFIYKGQKQIVARDVTFEIPAKSSIALIGRNGAGKSSFLKLLAGVSRPDVGHIRRSGSVSWPVGFQGSFHGDLTGAENARFVARLYDQDINTVLAFVLDFSELAEHLYTPVRHYSSGMRARLAFAISMAIPFDLYLVDEVTAVGDAHFQQKSEAMLRKRLETSGAIIVSHAETMLKRLCTSGVVLDCGRLFYYQRVEKALEHHGFLLRGERPPWMT